MEYEFTAFHHRLLHPPIDLDAVGKPDQKDGASGYGPPAVGLRVDGAQIGTEDRGWNGKRQQQRWCERHQERIGPDRWLM